jgi:EAL domain-containing protein (putative c-di-GMP-specific phosphodiesterase class I)
MSTPGPLDADYLRLQAEWQRFRERVLDEATHLPTLSAVLDDVRRLLEERGSLLLVFLDLGGEPAAGPARHAPDPDDDERVAAFAAALLALRTEGALTARDLVAVMSAGSDKFLVFVRGGESGIAPDPAVLEERVDRLGGRLRELLAQRLPAAAAVLHYGHSLMYRDPMLRAERSLHRALDEALTQCRRQQRGDEVGITQGLDEIIGAGAVVTLFQPIVDLATLAPFAHEAFSRGPAGGPFEDGDRLFALAERSGRLQELERLCRERALASAPGFLAPGLKLFLNTPAGALADPEATGPAFVQQVDAQGLAHGDVVLEIAERAALEERQAYRQMLRLLRREGFGIAIGDLGAGYGSLQTMVELEPDYLKFDVAMVRRLRSDVRRSVLETLVELADKIGARVIGSGLESEAEVHALRELGVGLGQGRHLAPPVMIPCEAPVLP